ncbi:hypothetical protein M3Y97_00674000 [Aphelenchoides bicaudatus]|nr:hypothetical protein M3Y97_00674000 [Aphelenchoides bicaudatus]
MSSATFDSTAPNAGLISNADATEDSLLAYTYPADENREDVHYLAIPVDTLNTRSVTIQVFYDQGRGSPTIMKLTSEKNTRTVVLNGNMKLFKANSAEKKQLKFDPFITQSSDADQFESMDAGQFHADNDPMLLDSQLNSSYAIQDECDEDENSFLATRPNLLEEKSDSMFFDETVLVETPTDDYAQADYQNAFTVDADISRPINNIQHEQPHIPVYTLEDERDSPIQIYPGPPPKTHRCLECNKMFPTLRSLKNHSSVHAPAIYGCSNCRKTFGSILKLKRHSLIHDSVRPFPCEFKGCQKSFTTRSNLNVHQRVHTGQKPYVCSVCARAFSHQSHAKAHLQIHLKKASLAQYGIFPRIREQRMF